MGLFGGSMHRNKVRAAGVALVGFALVGPVASPALASPGVTVSSLSSLATGAKAGTLRGEVANRTGRAVPAPVTVRIQRSGAAAKFVGATTVKVPASASAAYTVAVKLPGGLSRGNYYLAACTPDGSGDLGCATSQQDIRVKGGAPTRGAAAALPKLARGARAASAEDC